MNNFKEVTERTTHTSKLSLTSPLRLQQLVSIFTLIWENSKNPNYSVIFEDLFEGINISSRTVSNIKKAALRRKLFIPTQGNAIRFKNDLCKPNSLMLINFIQNDVRMHHVHQFNDITLKQELEKRGYLITR